MGRRKLRLLQKQANETISLHFAFGIIDLGLQNTNVNSQSSIANFSSSSFDSEVTRGIHAFTDVRINERVQFTND